MNCPRFEKTADRPPLCRVLRSICENYSPHKTADDHHGDCSGTKFYHWGALTGMITLIEEGYY